jgi:hypothetical protein
MICYSEVCSLENRCYEGGFLADVCRANPFLGGVLYSRHCLCVCFYSSCVVVVFWLMIVHVFWSGKRLLYKMFWIVYISCWYCSLFS